MSPYPRILTVMPVWDLSRRDVHRVIKYHFLPGGEHVAMAKRYRSEAKKRGHFVSLRQKAEMNPNVKKLAGAIYFGIYGGYPHYINMPGMAFNFDELKSIVKDVHDNLKVKRAFLHAWGTFSNYVPNNWPISEELGGVAKLREAVTLAKEYGYLYSSYHAYIPRLEHDPDFDMDLLPRQPDGRRIIRGRWARVDPARLKELAEKTLPMEIAAIGQNADVTDISFIGLHDESRLALAKYIRSLGLVMGTEHGAEHWIPYFDLFEGMTHYYGVINATPLSVNSHHAPLFNLVYHDAFANYGKIQDPDNDISFKGDFRTKSLQNLLFGMGTLIFFAPYEYPGLRDMIRMANELVAPVHEATFFEELTGHEFLSPDFKLQRSRFANGVEVAVNLGPVKQSLPEGDSIPGYGFRITGADGEVKSGRFNLSLNFESF
jgi:hypothetical protein